MLIPLFYLLICITLIFLLLLFPGIAHEGTDLGVNLFMEALFPYLLPYLILTQWFIRLTPNTSNSSSRLKLYLKTYGISALGGFPTGAATISYLKKSDQISIREANILLSICHSPSPLFVLGFVGNDLLNSTTFSWQFLFLYHGVSLLFLFWAYRYFHKEKKGQPIAMEAPAKTTNPFTSSVKDSIPTVLVVASTIIFFTTIYTVVMHSVKSFFPDIPDQLMLLIAAMLEMTNGLQIGQELFANQPTLLPILLTTFLTCQSLSIHMQVGVIAKTEQLSLKPYILMRILFTLLIPVLFYFIFL
ncbi:hypothetical protein D1B33_02565 [Lysinibacillus yapensis]|uniref:Sporulation integral membrane protein YlbJ n=1 Tax=Ureibacillus yapensis TaxID=2304605 RepID=A0A396STE6_9BACL|nr:hypothetical protein [Lysinibacillus yapensis]RHW39751.1 hypothetical protein D1B33_02565 [Lysinibacillus yapensis]